MCNTRASITNHSMKLKLAQMFNAPLTGSGDRELVDEGVDKVGKDLVISSDPIRHAD